MISTGHRRVKQGRKTGSNNNTRTLQLPKPPVPNLRGTWVLRENFTGQKSFGHFTCGGCNKEWISAHAFVAYMQQCKACQFEAYPTYMWVNDEAADRTSDHEDQEMKPHLCHLCGACKAGVCTAMRWC